MVSDVCQTLITALDDECVHLIILIELHCVQLLLKPHVTYCLVSKWNLNMKSLLSLKLTPSTFSLPLWCSFKLLELVLLLRCIFHWAQSFIMQLKLALTSYSLFHISLLSFCTCCVCSTGSSLMPQKKNADSLELIRSKAGRVFGNVRPPTKDVKSSVLMYLEGPTVMLCTLSSHLLPVLIRWRKSEWNLTFFGGVKCHDDIF